MNMAARCMIIALMGSVTTAGTRPYAVIAAATRLARRMLYRRRPMRHRQAPVDPGLPLRPACRRLKLTAAPSGPEFNSP